MDNLGAHKAPGVEEVIDAVGASVWWLPPYSPDLNPIEKLWSKVKSRLRRAAAGTVGGLTRAAGEACENGQDSNALTGAYLRRNNEFPDRGADSGGLGYLPVWSAGLSAPPRTRA